MIAHLRLLAVLCAMVALGGTAAAQTVWSGFTFEFTKPDGADGELPENQDEITPDVKLARGVSGGLYNAVEETNFLRLTSPLFTEWATQFNNPGVEFDATDYDDLVFEEFTSAYGFQVNNNILNGNAVLYLTLDDIYLDIQFVSWTTANEDPSGGFSYLRAEPPDLSEPTGDYNGDEIVDAADYTVWRNTLGQDADPEGSGADGNSNGEIDDGDYDYWRARYGNPVPEVDAGGLAVPEPGVIGLLFCSSIIQFLGRRKR